MARYYDNHTLYIASGVATEKQIRTEINKAIQSLEPVAKPRTDIRISVVADAKGNLYGWSYCRFSNPVYYWMFLGKNPDGSERVLKTPDQSWTPPSDEEPLDLQHSSSGSWADMVEEEEEYQQRHTRPVIVTPLPPLLLLNDYTYQSGQREAHIALEARNAAYEKRKVQEVKSTLVVSPAYVKEVSEEYNHNIICGRSLEEAGKIPAWIKESDLRQVFSRHSKKKEYPTVVFNHRRHAFITFDPSTHEAAFALLVEPKLEIVVNGQRCTLLFKHSYRTTKC